MPPPSFLWDEPLGPEATSPRLDAALDAMVKEFFAGRTGGPVTLAVYGPWGSGKTTVLRQLRSKLDAREAVTIWFDPWRYEREEDLMVPLLTELTSGIVTSAKMTRNAKEAVVKTGYKLLGRVAKAGLRASANFVADKIGLDSSDIEKLGEEFMKHYEDEASRFQYPVSERERFSEDFQRLIELASTGSMTGKLSSDTARPVCILIDDLDRCDPEKVKTLLESMKNFMWVPGVTYVLAVDREQVTTAIAEPFMKMYGEQGPDGFANAYQRARAYLEKFFLHGIDIGDDTAGFLQHTVAPAKAALLRELKHAIPNAHPPLVTRSAWREIELIYGFSDNNLRRVKRILRWLYFAICEKDFQNQPSPLILARLADQVFAETFPTIYLDLLDGEPADVKATYYSRLSGLLSLVAEDVDGRYEVSIPVLWQIKHAVGKDDTTTSINLSESGFPADPDIVESLVAPFRGTRTVDYLLATLGKRDSVAIDRMLGLSGSASSIDL